MTPWARMHWAKASGDFAPVVRPGAEDPQAAKASAPAGRARVGRTLEDSLRITGEVYVALCNSAATLLCHCYVV